MEPVEVRTEGIEGESLPPQPGRGQIDVKGGVAVDAVQHVYLVDVGIDALI